RPRLTSSTGRELDVFKAKGSKVSNSFTFPHSLIFPNSHPHFIFYIYCFITIFELLIGILGRLASWVELVKPLGDSPKVPISPSISCFN
ncbi:hypothetical protein H5410_046131, partial [Solanum commersonii]